MPDYQKMYHAMFNGVTDAITKLQETQQKTEEMYMDSKEPVLTPLRGGAGEEKTGSTPGDKPKKNTPSRDER